MKALDFPGISVHLAFFSYLRLRSDLLCPSRILVGYIPFYTLRRLPPLLLRLFSILESVQRTLFVSFLSTTSLLLFFCPNVIK